MIDGSLKMEADEEIEDTELRPTKVGRYYSKSRAQFLPLLSALLDDPLLADVPRNPILGDVDTLIAVELGGAMRLSVLKMDGTTLVFLRCCGPQFGQSKRPESGCAEESGGTGASAIRASTCIMAVGRKTSAFLKGLVLDKITLVHIARIEKTTYYLTYTQDFILVYSGGRSDDVEVVFF